MNSPHPSRSIGSNYFYNALLTATNVLFPVVTFPYVLRVIGPEGIGKVTLATTIVGYFMVLASFGLGTYGLRQVARDRDDREQLGRTFTELLALNLAFSVLALIGFLSVLFWYPFAQQEGLLYAVTSLTIVLSVLSFDWFLQGTEDFRFVALRSIAIKSASLVFLFVFVRKPEDYVVYALVNAFALGANNVFNVSRVRQSVTLIWRNLKPFRHLPGMSRFVLITLAAGLYAGIDKLWIANAVGSIALGYYAPAEKLARLCLSVIVALPAVAYPRMANYFQKGDRRAARQLVSSSLSLCLLFAIPILVGGELLSSTIVLVFAGQAFSPSVRTFQILLGLVLPVSLSTVLVFQVLLASGREHLYNFVIVGELALFVLLNAVFVSLWNQDGAAAALVITELFGLVAVALLSRGLGVVALDWKNTFKTLSAALVMGVVVMLLQQGLLTGHNPELLVLVLCTVAGILVYGGCLAVFREENTNKFVRLILSKA